MIVTDVLQHNGITFLQCYDNITNKTRFFCGDTIVLVIDNDLDVFGKYNRQLGKLELISREYYLIGICAIPGEVAAKVEIGLGTNNLVTACSAAFIKLSLLCGGLNFKTPS